MQTAQRLIMVLLVCMCLVMGITTVSMEEREKEYSQWECVHTERFLQKICRTGKLLTEEYVNYEMGLNQSNVIVEVRIEEYRKEQDMNGTNYYYLVTWDEVKRMLQDNGRYIFHEESVIKLMVTGKLSGRTGKKEYYVMISEKE